MYGLYLLIQEEIQRNNELHYTHKWSEDPHPITNYVGEHNNKPREVYCPSCHYTVVTNLPGPICSQCRSWLIVVPKSR